MAGHKSKSFLSRLGKRGKEIAERAAYKERELTFDELIAKRWGEAITDADWAADHFQRLVDRLRETYPKLSTDQIELMLRLQRFRDRLEKTAVARRVVLEDPTELVLGLRMTYRVAYAVRGQWKSGCDVDQLLPMCAVGDIEFARRVAKGRRGASHAIPHPGELINIATVAWLNKDRDTEEIVVKEIEATSMKYVSPWEQAMLAAFCAAHHRDSAAVAGRISDLLDSIKKLRDKKDIDHIINLWAHGLYRLFENDSPELVESFDATQGFPWDPEVHAWCDEHPAFSEDWDFSAISKELHQIVVSGKVPRWLPKLPAFYQVELLEADPAKEDVLDVVDSQLSYSEHDPMTIINAFPVVFHFELEQEIAEDKCRKLNMVGCKARVSKQKEQPYRPISS
jgi:hypothetical protein